MCLLYTRSSACSLYTPFEVVPSGEGPQTDLSEKQFETTKDRCYINEPKAGGGFHPSHGLAGTQEGDYNLLLLEPKLLLNVNHDIHIQSHFQLQGQPEHATIDSNTSVKRRSGRKHGTQPPALNMVSQTRSTKKAKVSIIFLPIAAVIS